MKTLLVTCLASYIISIGVVKKNCNRYKGKHNF